MHTTSATHPTRRPLARVLLLPALLTSLLCALPAQADGPKPPATASTAQTSNAGGVVNLNTADETQLTHLPGIGASKAKKILELRTRMKRFKRVEDIMRVKGIGRKTFRKLRPMLSLDGATTLQPTKKKKRASR